MRKITSPPKLGEFTQGSIFKNIRTAANNLLPGVVITARCDIAQKKAKSILCLPIYTLEHWMTNFGDIEAFKSSEKSIKKDLSQILSKYKISPRATEIYGATEVLRKLENRITDKEREKLLTLSSTLESGKINRSVPASEKQRQRIAEDVVLNKRLDTYFLERIINEEHASGYVIDLSEPIVLSIDALKDLSKGLEHVIYNRERHGKYHGLHVENGDIGCLISTINSPYIEHILQKFSFLFSRIGTSNISNVDFETLRSNYDF